jgi:hypothetical protein
MDRTLKIYSLTPKTKDQLNRLAFRKNVSLSGLMKTLIRKELAREFPGEPIE